MDLCYDLRGFANEHSEKKIAVFLHTSAVIQTAQEIRNLFAKKPENVSFYLPENCVSELKLLQQSSSYAMFRQKAEILLQNCSTVSAWSYFSMRASLAPNSTRSFLEAYHCNIAVFVFLEPSAADAFQRLIGGNENVYISCYDPYDANRPFNSPRPSSQPISRRCNPLSFTPTNNKIYGDRNTLRVYDSNNQPVGSIPCSALEEIHSGGEALLFTLPGMPGKLVKIYMHELNGDPCYVSLNKSAITKLRQLIALSNAAPPGCVLPTELVYRGSDCVGFIMNQIDGSPLAEVFCLKKDIAERKKILRDFSVILLELRLHQFYMTDLSLGNIHIGKDGKIRLLDCDSMEFMSHPGGGTTPPFGHPGIDGTYVFSKLREAKHLDFAYAVLVFITLFDMDHPLTQGGHGTDEPEWGKFKFPYANRDGEGVVINGAIVPEEHLRNWRSQPYEVRQSFVNVFNFIRTYDIGEWAKTLHFC